ncbi:MAG: 30S ribosomal protein S3 [Synergistaceae bacterium]|nr:30S ribosomal protein S3 [Synergistaceae bacterium]
MGQKVHPVGYRLGITTEWESKWYAGPKDYARKLHEDLKLRKWIMAWKSEKEDKKENRKDGKDRKDWKDAGISRVEIERVGHVVRFTIWTARPGILIGKGGDGIQKMKDNLQKLTGGKVMINVQEVKNPDVVAQLVARNIASSLENRVSFRRAMKQAIFRATKAGAKGIKAQVAGRLGGAEIARTEWYNEGRLPLSTIRADIDYGFAEAVTMYGVIGCKIWIYRDRENEHAAPQRSKRDRGGR